MFYVQHHETRISWNLKVKYLMTCRNGQLLKLWRSTSTWHKALRRLKISSSNVEVYHNKQLVTCSKSSNCSHGTLCLDMSCSLEVKKNLRFWMFWAADLRCHLCHFQRSIPSFRSPWIPLDPFLLAGLHGPAVDLVSSSSELSVPPSWVTLCMSRCAWCFTNVSHQNHHWSQWKEKR